MKKKVKNLESQHIDEGQLVLNQTPSDVERNCGRSNNLGAILW